ncbi:hypothetical protein IMY05_007G0040300 [Salix suchowensis]|nr:hypothetical protein IMY05_007G0040300 [Salix suchowensis]
MERNSKPWGPQDGWGPTVRMRNRKYLYLHCIGFQNLSSWASQKTTGHRSMWLGRILSRSLSERAEMGGQGFKKLSHEQAALPESNADAVWSCDVSKAPGLDGYNFR